MDALMLDGWTPIFLIGIVVAIIIFFISRKISKVALLSTSIVLSLVCFGIILYSREGVGGWEGIGLLFVTLSGLIGVWVGTIIGVIGKKQYDI